MRSSSDQSVGVKYGRLIVKSVRRQKQKSYTQTLAYCVCDCGNELEVLLGSLRLGRQKSCGCYLRDNPGQLSHGLSKTRAYRIWRGMLTRCYNPNTDHFARYGGRGITVCDRWKNFENFFSDMGHPPDNMTLDRVDNDLGYSKENCRWVDRRTQARNTSRNRLITHNKITKTLIEWCEDYGLKFHTVLKRLDRSGWDFKRAITEPLKGKKS